MYSFLILGQIPGTDIVITWGMWLLLGAAVLGTVVAVKLRGYRRMTVQNSDATDYSVAL
jgi:hypothetical protein